MGADAAKTAGKRMMKCITEQGLPVPSNPMLLGNLFLMLDIEFPTELGPDAIAALKGALPPPLNVPSVTEEDEGVEVHHMESMVSSVAAQVRSFCMALANRARHIAFLSGPGCV